MTPEQLQRLNSIEQKLNDFISVYYKTNFPDQNIFDKTILVNNGLRFSNEAIILSGTSTTNATIAAEVGTLPVGSVYISSNGAGEIWVMQTSTWTKLTIP